MLPKNPTVIIDLCKKMELAVTKKSERVVYEALDKHFDTPKLFESLLHDGMCFERYIEGFLMNSFTSSHKIIVTDWAEPKSPRPITDDPNFPIKSLITLANYALIYNKALSDFVYNSSFDVSIGVMCSHSEFLYHDSRFEGLRRSGSISIAFLGKDIKSAKLEIEKPDFNQEAIRLKALDFKKKLESQCFPLKNGRVFGFYFEERPSCYDRDDFQDVAFKTVSKIFPSIKLFRIPALYTQDYDFEEEEEEIEVPINLHLIGI